MISPTDMRGLRLAYGILEDDLHVAADGLHPALEASTGFLPALRSAAVGTSKITSPSKVTRPDVGGRSRRMTLPRVVLPQPDSPDETERLAAADVEAHAVDGADRADRRRAEQAALDLEVLDDVLDADQHLVGRAGRGRGGQCGGDGVHGSLVHSTVRAAADFGGGLRGRLRADLGRPARWRQPAPGEMARRADGREGRRDVAQRRRDVADRHRVRAAALEQAAGGEVQRVGDDALDDLEPFALLAEARDRGEQALRVRVMRLGVDGVDVGPLDDLAGVHHDDLVGHLGDHAQVVGDEHDRHLVLLAQRLHELEDLGLDRDVERGGRLVGDEQLRVRARAPSRS